MIKSLCLTATLAIAKVQNWNLAELDEKIATGEKVFVKFFNPGCPHCVNMASAWEELAAASTDQIGEINCRKEHDACQRFAIRGVPSLALIQSDKVYRYAGQRTLEAMKTFLDTGFSAVEAESLPVAGTVKTPTAIVSDYLTELLAQLRAILKYSPVSVVLILCLGLLVGVLSTALIALNLTSPSPKEERGDKEETTEMNTLKEVTRPKTPREKKNE
jgi:thioredoxin-like negative regulator of GroEL